jgi:long-chain acyl-CoA synthetase
VACPLNVRWSKPELAFALQDSQAALLVVDEGPAALAPHEACPVLRFTALQDEASALTPLPDSRTGGDALAALLYTGGTTGRSKGVMLSHANFWTASMTRGAELNNAPDSVSLAGRAAVPRRRPGPLVGQLIVAAAA